MKIHTCEQGSAEWFKVRAGMPTASEFSTVMASGKDGGASKTRRTYMFKLAGELLTGQPSEGFSGVHLDRGKAMEAEARERYALETEADPEQIGFITDGLKGCSPDGLIDHDGALEIKTKLPHLMIDVLLRDVFPAEHKAQCQGVLWVAEREWIDIMVYWPKMRPFIKRAYRDEAYIDAMAKAVDEFNAELADLVAKVRALGAPLSEAA